MINTLINLYILIALFSANFLHIQILSHISVFLESGKTVVIYQDKIKDLLYSHNVSGSLSHQ